MSSIASTTRTLILIAAAVGFTTSAAGAVPAHEPVRAAIVDVRQDFPWFVPDGRGHDRDRWSGWWDHRDDDHDRRDRRRRGARDRCDDRDPISFFGRWQWDRGECRWQNGRPER